MYLCIYVFMYLCIYVFMYLCIYVKKNCININIYRIENNNLIVMLKYFNSSLRKYIIMIIILFIFIISLFLPYIVYPIKEGLEGAEPKTINIDEYSRFYLDAIIDDIKLNDPKMNSSFSIDLLKDVGVGDDYINNTLSNLDLIIPEKIKRVNDYLIANPLVV